MYLAIALVAALTFVLSAFSLWLERLGVPPLQLALLAGVLAGPFVFGVVDPQGLGVDSLHVLEEITRVTLVMALLGVALRFPAGYWSTNRRWVIASIGVGMLVMFAVATGAVLLAGIPLLTAMLIAAAITPTDPVVTTPIVTGPLARERIPERVRLNMSSESGLNDGLGYLLLMLPVLLLTRETGTAWSEWLTATLLLDVTLAVALGLVAGWAAGRLLDKAIERGWTEDVALFGYALAFAIGMLGMLRVLGADAVLGVFVAGAMFGRQLAPHLREQLGERADALARIFILPVFALLGVLLPLDAWGQAGFALVAVLLLAVIGRRLAGIWLTRPIYAPLHSRAESAFMSAFGPVGVSALFYACVAVRHTGEDIVFTAVTLAITLSVIVHGLATRPLGEWLQRKEAARAG
ncbi:cation:proton antiporter [Microbacterium sp. LRZ72]|uniref:cation:proton antiporter domain-containing protein n=1 Tax=Microbacterium sp. LRZ72 TaxID=2942481 RepID=UPI0029AC4636|nr:cation:proton antiporter [Microbacterium sp. LRZ72]MDX2377691.1 cation:proton antiporter [Microbacterium sp. LRZ72]